MTADDRGTRVRLFITCWLVLTLHFATNIVREHYPALTLAERGSFQVDEYLGLNPDLFVAPSGKAYITNNPGVSVLAAVPLFLFRPVLAVAEAYGKRKVAEAGGQVSAVYEDHRPNRLRFYRQIRERGLDLKLGLVALITVALCMSPLTALAGVVTFDVLRRFEIARGPALFLALLSVFGTPLFFRNAYLSHNHVLGLLVFFAFVLVWRQEEEEGGRLAPWALAGFLGGFAVFCDYSGVVSLAFLSAYAWMRSRRGAVPENRNRGRAARLGWFAVGAALPLAALLLYQWDAFGSPLRPAQALMPPTPYSVLGRNGLTWPQPDLVVANLVDPRFGLFAFGPLLLLALPGPWLMPAGWLRREETWLVAAYGVGLLLFSSANQFARLQWNTGVRYLIPLVPFLFVYAVPALLRLPRLAAYTVAVLAVAHAWSLAMVRESVPESLLRVLVAGFQLPFLTVLGKMATQYVPTLEAVPSPLPIFALCAALLWGIWRIRPAGSRNARGQEAIDGRA